MKNQRLAAFVVLLCCSVSTPAHESPTRKIVLKCPPDRQPMMWDIERAIEYSDYFAPPSVRREMLARAREACTDHPSMSLTFMPPADAKGAPSMEIASKGDGN
jgi:hypothetical protein